MHFNKSDELDIQALADGALDPENEQRVRKLITQNQAHQRRYHSLLLQKQLLLAWWASEEDAEEQGEPLEMMQSPVYVQ